LHLQDPQLAISYGGLYQVVLAPLIAITCQVAGRPLRPRATG
jgi:hypothetical protein